MKNHDQRTTNDEHKTNLLRSNRLRELVRRRCLGLWFATRQVVVVADDLTFVLFIVDDDSIEREAQRSTDKRFVLRHLVARQLINKN